EGFSSDGLAWSPDGKIIAIGINKPYGQMEIEAVRLADGKAHKIGNRDWGRLGNLAWLPDGSGLVVLARETAVARRGQVWFVAHPNGEARTITNDLNIYLVTSLSLSADSKLAVLQGHILSSIWVAPDGVK